LEKDIIHQLFAKYYNEAMLYTMSLCRDRSLAEDIVSEAFFKALSSSDDTVKNFKPWLLTVCRNEYLIYLRKHKHFSDEELSEETAAEEDRTLEKIIKSEEYRALYHAISLLPSSQKEIIHLFYFSGLSVKEIAGITNKSETNVKVILCRAREDLRKKLEEQI